ncbi:winged helix-turn-helix transcriptional regulator [Tardiphaga sp. 804_B3_N1_9]|uniref:winged helix-turn-helix transcriptional regulator n=1 Tax=Tardiphaga sp. 804_B3_N1_9 TaxID=3240786 RepID=UPI003F25AF6A
MNCSVARSLDRVGEWWTILILRDAIAGKRRFQEFAESLEIPPNILTRRLERLVSTGVMERRLYCTRPPRYEYVLTQQGRDFSRVVDALREWDARNFATLRRPFTPAPDPNWNGPAPSSRKRRDKSE